MSTQSLTQNRKVDDPYFTLFTPVYNGEKFLSRVFESISNQTFKNFEWIVIDDGSTDNSRYLINNYIDQHPEIDIQFISQNNSGKHIAWNKSVGIARGRLLSRQMLMTIFALIH